MLRELLLPANPEGLALIASLPGATIRKAMGGESHCPFRAESYRYNALIIGNDVEAAVRTLKAERDGEIEVAGPALAHDRMDGGVLRLTYVPA